MYVLSLPKANQKIEMRISNSLSNATLNMLQNEFREIAYHLNVVRVTKRGDTEHL